MIHGRREYDNADPPVNEFDYKKREVGQLGADLASC